MKIGSDISKIRKIRGYSQTLLASKIGVSNKHLNMIEHGKVYPSWKLLDKILEALSIDIGFIFKDWFMVLDAPLNPNGYVYVAWRQ